MQIIIDEKLAFNVGTTMRNGLCMMICDTPGGELFTYLHWETKQKAIEIEAYSHHPVTVSVKTGKEVKAMIMFRPQFVLIYGLEEELPGDATREEGYEWIEREGDLIGTKTGIGAIQQRRFFLPRDYPLYRKGAIQNREKTPMNGNSNSAIPNSGSINVKLNAEELQLIIGTLDETHNA